MDRRTFIVERDEYEGRSGVVGSAAAVSRGPSSKGSRATLLVRLTAFG
jgi:hypothetical protein